MAVASMGASPEHWFRDTEPEDDEAFEWWLDTAIAGFCREAQDPGSDEWKPVRLTSADVATMDQRDRLWLSWLVLRLLTPEQITAAVEAGVTDPKEVAGELDRLAEFRDDGRGPAGGDDGAGVGRPPVRVAEG